MTEGYKSQVHGSDSWMKWKYIFLTLALLELVIGFSELRPDTFFFLGRPLERYFLGCF
ncbi:MAG: hypothetical protein ACLQVW_30340 [Limisphaerales bacterium]